MWLSHSKYLTSLNIISTFSICKLAIVETSRAICGKNTFFSIYRSIYKLLVIPLPLSTRASDICAFAMKSKIVCLFLQALRAFFMHKFAALNL